MEVRFTWDKVKHLKCRISWHFIRLWCAVTTSFWSQGAFILPKGTPMPIRPATATPLSSLWIYIFWIFCRNRITQCVALCAAMLSMVAQMVKNLPTRRETQVQSLGLEDPLEKGMPTLSSIPGVSLVAHTVKNLPAIRETLVWPLDWEDPQEKGMATHSRILFVPIPIFKCQKSQKVWRTPVTSPHRSYQ